MSGYFNDDTICAISTAAFPAGIGIVRISGNNSFFIISKVFKYKSSEFSINNIVPNRAYYGEIFDDNVLVDRVIVTCYKAPHSFTGEDTVEISCHGNLILLNQVLSLCVRLNSRIAYPGEFSFRSLRSGKMSLPQVECFAEFISASSETALNNSKALFSGKIFQNLSELNNILLDQAAFLNVCIDEPDEYCFEDRRIDFSNTIRKVYNELTFLLGSYQTGYLLKNGVKCVLCGAPNSGKSSLFNCLCENDKAIVTDIPGTTRDLNEASVIINGVLFRIFDSAGIRANPNLIEKIGIDKLRLLISDVDFILLVIDASRPFTDHEDIISILPTDRKVFVILNKIDLNSLINISDIKPLFPLDTLFFKTSALKGLGIDELRCGLQNSVISFSDNDESVFLSNARHFEHIKKAVDFLSEFFDDCDSGFSEDLLLENLTAATNEISLIFSVNNDDLIIEKIFSNFCVGK